MVPLKHSLTLKLSLVEGQCVAFFLSIVLTLKLHPVDVKKRKGTWNFVTIHHSGPRLYGNNI